MDPDSRLVRDAWDALIEGARRFVQDPQLMEYYTQWMDQGRVDLPGDVLIPLGRAIVRHVAQLEAEAEHRQAWIEGITDLLIIAAFLVGFLATVYHMARGATSPTITMALPPPPPPPVVPYIPSERAAMRARGRRPPLPKPMGELIGLALGLFAD
jgi:hypothetical protein